MTNSVTTYLALVFALAAPAVAQERFDSADAAAQALVDSLERHDAARIAAIFGPQGNTILTSGNPTQDRAEQSEFSRLAGTKHRLSADPMNPNRVILWIGDEDWPFPAPIVSSNGKWSFDVVCAQDEMAARRIGAHEMDAMEICAGYVEAQKKYASEDRGKDGVVQYASHMMSAANGHGGLVPLVPQGLANATWDGHKKSTTSYHGYFFRILDGQGPHAPGGAHNFRVKNKLMGGFWAGGLASRIWSDRRPDVYCESGRRDLSEGHSPGGRRRDSRDHTVRSGPELETRKLS